jgi:hypothetical protein
MLCKKYFINHISIAAILLAVNGCMIVPDKYLEPIKKRQIDKKKTISIEGFEVGSFQTTGYSASSDYGAVSGRANNTNVSGSYYGGGITTHNQYVVTSLAEEFRGILAGTGCFTVVAPNTKSDLVLVGRVNSQGDMSWHYFVQFLEGLTLTPLFGMPVPERGSGSASANIYKYGTGELIESVSTGKIYLSGWLTIYSSDKEKEGLATIRTMAMRDLAEEMADRFCNQK